MDMINGANYSNSLSEYFSLKSKLKEANNDLVTVKSQIVVTTKRIENAANKRELNKYLKKANELVNPAMIALNRYEEVYEQCEQALLDAISSCTAGPKNMTLETLASLRYEYTQSEPLREAVSNFVREHSASDDSSNEPGAEE